MITARLLKVSLSNLVVCLVLGFVQESIGKSAKGDTVGIMKAERFEVLFADDFERSELGSDWIEHFRESSIQDGVLLIQKLPDLHPAIARREMELHDVIIDFELRLIEAKRALLVVNGEGHVLHVAFRETAGGVEVSIKDYARGGSTAFATASDESAGQWRRISLVLVGDQLEAIVDGRSVVSLRSPGLAMKKSLFQLNGVGAHVAFDNLEVWSIAP